tara:strand:+ start:5192 stop:5809 length:618 start_codon:yes stop_codon:yes gene_type:complete
MTNVLIIIILFLFLLSSTNCDKIEGFKKVKEIDVIFNDNDFQYIPISTKQSFPMINDYYVRPNKYLGETRGFINTILRSDKDYFDKYFTLPMDEPNSTRNKKRDSIKTYLSQFLFDSPLDEEDLREIYIQNDINDKYMINDPFDKYHKVGKTESLIITDDIDTTKVKTCYDVKCPVGKKKYSHKLNYPIFMDNNKQTNDLCCGPY